MRIPATILALAAIAAVGCAAPLTAHLASSRLGERRAGSKEEPHLENGPRAASVRKATAAQPPTQEEAFAGILQELQDIRAIDPEAERELMADLKDAKPENYPMIVEAFRTALAYRQQLAERQQRAVEEGTLLATDDSLARLVSHEVESPSERESVERASAVRESLAAAKAQDDQSRYANVALPRRYQTPLSTAPVASDLDQRQPADPPSRRAAGPADAGFQNSIVTAAASEVPEETAIASDRTAQRPPRAKALQPTAAKGDWHAELNRSIADLETTISAQPTSVNELHDHMRLRTLQLLAGRQEDAFRPIPGASADQQDYWSKQLFAMSAYLDANSKLDDKQRSSAALQALDEARAKLAELSTLQVRNAAFVSSVDGFGAYEPAKTTKFQPGQKVALYAEVENFRSNSAEDGYHTSLATSYQVLEVKTGRRIEGKQFPDIADKCRNRRRDFHMQYEFPLPTRIYPGEYQLELTITDHHSGKIGQTTLPFEIVGEP